MVGEGVCTIIIVEGCDNTGKTRLIEQLVKKFPTLKRIKRGGKEKLTPWLMKQLLDEKGMGRRIYDRFFLSEFIYGPIVRGTIVYTEEEEDFIWRLLVMIRPLIIICHRESLSDAVFTLHEREQMEGVHQNYVALSERYRTIVDPMLSDHGLSSLWYDFAEEEAFEGIVVPQVGKYLGKGY